MPISSLDLRRYIAFLASRLSFTSIRQYLNVVRLMHVESGHTNPLSDSWYLSSILKGLRRFKGDSTRPKLPMTCHILQRILSLLGLTRSFDFTFWAVCLVGFFSFFRKSNLLVPSLAAFDPQKHLCQSDVTLEASGAVISVRWSKTIQFRQRNIHIPLPHIPGSPFCPSNALYLCLHMVHLIRCFSIAHLQV